MDLRLSRPAAIEGIKVLKASQGLGDDYDVNKQASRQEMRSYVCAQCHVEYYFAQSYNNGFTDAEGKPVPDNTLTFPWSNGTDIDDMWAYYRGPDAVTFTNPDGVESTHTDINHAITGAKVVKAQHPEFEVWSEGVHADNNVSCADCHMSYTREGSQKVSNHHVTTPMADMNGTCGTCHAAADLSTLETRVTTIQNRFVDSRDRALDALEGLIFDLQPVNGVRLAKLQAEGTELTPAQQAVVASLDGLTDEQRAFVDSVTDEQFALAKQYQDQASFYVDFMYSENSFGFHAPDYAQRVLSQSLEASLKGQLALRGVSAEDLAPSDVAAAHAQSARESGKI
jgi:nitrite reductase (cytochrome c-552)